MSDVAVKKVPELRFCKFFNSWNKCKLSDVSSYRNGKAHERNIVSFGKYIVINSKFISTEGKVKKYSNVLIAPLFKNELAFVLSDLPNGKALSKVFLVPENNKYSLNQRIAGITPHEGINSYFLKNLLNRNKFFKKFDDGVSQTNLKRSDVESFSGFYPDFKEQEKIGTFFEQLDKLITLQQRKIDLLKKQKQGYLQKMFPKAGERVPELRFAGFSDDWNLKALGEVAGKFEYGLNASAKSYDGKNKYLRITDIDDESRNLKEDSLTSPNYDLNKAGDYKLQLGDILFARTGASVGKTYSYKETDGIVYYAGFLIRARIKDGFDYYFIFQNTLTNHYINYIKVNSQRSGQPGVNAHEYSNFKFLIPKFKEQEKIGLFFKQIDQNIQLQSKKIDSLKELKKGFLQKMFV